MRSITSEPNKEAIEILEDALEKVKSGEYSSIHVAWVTKDTGIGGTFSSGTNFLMWASIENAARSYYKNAFPDS